MKRNIIILAALALCLAGCGQKPDMYREALETEIIRLVGADAKVTFNTFERIDSTTFGQEVDNRIKAFTTKLNQDRKLYENYKSKGMVKNTEGKKKAVEMDEKILAGMEMLRQRIADADSLDVVAYYDYHFTGSAKSSEGVTEFNNNYAAITPDGKVLSMNDALKGLHNALGKTIPGYMNLIKDKSDE